MLTASQSLAFSYGLNPVTMGQTFGQASQIGVLGTNSTSGQMTPAQWAGLIANAVSAGGMQGRQGQVFSSMLSVSQQIASQIAQAPNENLIARIMTGLNQSGNPNLQGTLGAQVLGSINQGIQNPGMGSLGQLISYQSLNPNGKLGYFQEKYLQAQGLAGTNPTTGVNNFTAELGYFQKYLKHGRVSFMPGSHGTMPTESTALASSMLGNQWNITQPQALQVLKAFQGHTLQSVNQTAALAQQWGGSGALQHLLHIGGMNVFAGIANATGLNGKQGLNALAHQVSGSLHGHVNPHFYALEKQYQALGRIHATSVHQGAAIAHQRASDLAQMKKTLGQSVLGGPTLANSMDKLNTTMGKATAEWAKVAHRLQPLVHGLSHLNLFSANIFKRILSGTLIGPQSATAGAANSSYQMPGLSAQSGLGAVLTSFQQGNNQTLLTRYITASLNGSKTNTCNHNKYTNTSCTCNSGTGGGGNGTDKTVSWKIPSGSSKQATFMKNALPYAQQVAAKTGLSPSFFLTQWADETNWGQSMAGTNNLGNIKNPATGKFQSYSSLSAFAQADAQFYTQNSRYQPLLQAAHHGASTTQELQLVGQSGYATNPNYGSQLVALLSDIKALLRAQQGHSPLLSQGI